MNSNTDISGKPLDKLAAEVLARYGIVPESLAVVQSGAIKTVWKVKANGRLLCLKRLRQTIDKARFSVSAQIYIKNSGGLVPGIITDKSRQPIVMLDDQLFVLYEWINGSDLDFGSPADLKQAVQGLARFHMASRGYKPEDGSRISTKLGRWPEQYGSMKNKLVSWKETALNNISQPHYAAYAKYCDPMVALAGQAVERLGRSRYNRLTADDSPSIVLCHQDYGKGNAIAAGRDVYVLDLDGVTFDLPARDLRKIIGKLAENKGQWQAASIREILGWYMEVNPQNADEREALYTDLLFPHWFYGLVKNLFQGGKPVKASEIERIARLEESKTTVLKNLQN